MWVGPLATFRKLSRVSPNERVKEPDCSFPGRGGVGEPGLQEGPQVPRTICRDESGCTMIPTTAH